MMTDTLKEYYRQRATWYEAIYHRPDPIRLTEQEDLARAIRRHLVGRHVLEIAAGTGWWTVHAAAVACHVMATDANQETLDIAKSKPFDPDKTVFRVGDAYDLPALGSQFDGALSCCWLSHVRRADLQRFVSGLHAVLVRGAAVVIADNCPVPGVGGDFIAPHDEPDTYRRRRLENGDSQVILKNYYDRQELVDLFAEHAEDLQIHHGQHFWWLTYYLKA